LEEKKIEDIASSYENFSKAFLAGYGVLILLPVSIISVSNKAHLRFPRLVQNVINSFTNLVKDAVNEEKIAEKLKHDPIGKSHIAELLSTTSKLMFELKQRELGRLYRRVKEYITKPPEKRRYDELLNIRKDLVNSFSLRNLNDRILNLMRLCLLSPPEEAEGYCKQLSDEQKLIISTLIDEPYLLDQILSMLDLGNQKLFDYLLYTAFLTNAYIKRFTKGRTDEDWEYLKDVKDHQKEILENLVELKKEISKLYKSDEFDEYISEVEEKVRSLLETNQAEEKEK